MLETHTGQGVRVDQQVFPGTSLSRERINLTLKASPAQMGTRMYMSTVYSPAQMGTRMYMSMV
jgi:hypothetical protein